MMMETAAAASTMLMGVRKFVEVSCLRRSVVPLDIEAIRQGKKPAESTYHLGEEGGELRVLYGEVGN